VIYLAHLGVHLHQLLVSLDAGQGISLLVEVGADVLALAGAVGLRMNEVTMSLACMIEGFPVQYGQ